MVRQLFKRGAALGEQGILSAAALAVNILLARGLGPEHFGFFAIYLSVLLVAQTVQRSLVLTPMVVHYFKDETGSRSWMRLSLFLSLALSCIFFLASAAIALWGSSDISLLVLACGLGIPAYMGSEFQRRVMYLFEMPHKAFIATGASAVLQICFGFWIWISRADYFWALFGHLVVMYIVWALSITVAARLHTPSRLGPLLLARESKESLIWNLAATIPYNIYNNGMPLLLGFFSAIAQVGIYSGTRILVAPTTVLVAAVDGIEKPKASRAYSEKGLDGLKQALLNNVLTMCALGIPYVGFGLIFPGWTAHILLGSEYFIEDGVVRSWFAISFLMLLGQPLETGLVIMRKANWFFYSRLVAALVVIIIFFAQPYGDGAPNAIFAVLSAWSVATISAAVMLMLAFRKQAAV